MRWSGGAIREQLAPPITEPLYNICCMRYISVGTTKAAISPAYKSLYNICCMRRICHCCMEATRPPATNYCTTFVVCAMLAFL